jgi:hypothetical protein
LFLVHIPKTAGTTVNDVLSEQVASRIHIEGVPALMADLSADIPERFVSGHLSVPQALGLLDRSNWFVFTFLRDPVEQLISYLKWMQHSAKFDILQTFPDDQKDVCNFLLETNLSDVGRLNEMMSTLPAARYLFDNCQVRYLSGHLTDDAWVDRQHLYRAYDMVQELDLVGFTENLDDGLAKLVRASGLPLTIKSRRSNPGPPTARPDFSRPEVRDFYRSLVALDLELLGAIKSWSRRALFHLRRFRDERRVTAQ